MNSSSAQRAVLEWQFKEGLQIAHNVCTARCLNDKNDPLNDIEKVCLSKCFDRVFEGQLKVTESYSKAITKAYNSVARPEEFAPGFKKID